MASDIGLVVDDVSTSTTPRRTGLRPSWGEWIGLVIVTISVGCALLAPYITPFSPVEPTGKILSPPPSPGEVFRAIFDGTILQLHLLGTDSSGLDIFSRIVAAPRIDLTIALASTLIALVGGIVIGLLVGYFDNPLTAFVTRVSDTVQAFPVMIMAMILVVLGGGSLIALILGIAILYTPMFTRLTRAEAVSHRSRAYVEGSRALGMRETTIAFRHVLPNAVPPAIIQTPVIVGWAILLTASLSFVGAGVPPPTPELGSMIATGSSTLALKAWWPSFFPGIAISGMVLGFALVGRWLERWINA